MTSWFLMRTHPQSHQEKQEHETCQTQSVPWQKQLISIMEEDGTRIQNRDHIVKCCVEFYQKLYRSRRLPTDTMEPQQPHRLALDEAPPVILPGEIKASIKKLDCSMAPGEDNITGSVLQNSGEAIVNLLT